ncbi:hypothetical protein KQ51_00628 [Candidatus Izimaplasma bacterium HR1]|jgi:secondary thiamine-phosphate synthase enzyme|uniref:secondary thiamine-phosphate synthase enzyme YjbQ n=1 Tax=Candidatus Izimoplasma sp. HR1 TaxID=1541959 RepID=UPI0004F8690B|nr:hypothetical protein KQ51_00628 [Candidatus Izimaplasma bacterium HR1]
MICKTHIIDVRSDNEDEMINITSRVSRLIQDSGVTEGEVILFVPHTTAAITINENADPDVKDDMLLGLRRTFPRDKDYIHNEGNSHAHIKSSVIGVEKTILISKREMILGIWQAIYFMEFDGPRNRKLVVRISGK